MRSAQPQEDGGTWPSDNRPAPLAERTEPPSERSSVLVGHMLRTLLSSAATAQWLVSWEYANGCPAHQMVADRAPGRWCGRHRRHLYRGGAVDRLSHRPPFILRQLAEFAGRHRPRVPWPLAGPAQCRAVHRAWPGTALALAPQAASRSPRRQITLDRRPRQSARVLAHCPRTAPQQPGVSTMVRSTRPAAEPRIHAQRW